MGAGLNTAARSLGRYELLEYLGSGGMSDVFVAMHSGLRKRVALKLLRPSLCREIDSVRRFLREGQCAARVSHANVVDVLDVGMEEGVPYLVMELLEGETLERKLQRDGRMSLRAAVELLLPILDGVAATHAAGVLHRDIKPGNILLARNPDGSVVPKLVDFGIATLEERRGITGALGPIGTPHYMSPEQARGNRSLDERSDQYSLASMLFEMLTGREPFAGPEDDINDVLERVARGKFPRLSHHRSDLPSSIDEVLARASSFDPAKRFPRVTDFAEALLPFASERTRNLWVSRDHREGVASAQLLSGAFRVDNDIAGEPTSVTPVFSRGGQATRHLRRRKGFFSPTFVTMASVVLVLSVAVGYLRARTSPTPRPDATLAIGATLPGTLLDQATNPAFLAAAASSAQPQRRVYVTPADASVIVDGVSLGRGDFRAPTYFDDEVHELRVSAEGYVPRVVLFKKQLDVGHIALEPMSYAER
ncbi:MAG: serine/threonine-protein kinase [Myxococcales bacterium]